MLLGALWATFAAIVVRRRLRGSGLAASVPRPPRLSPKATQGVTGALRRLGPTCLERALVLQAWLASQGVMRDVVIGIPPDGMRKEPAHAWVDGTDVISPSRYLELHRLLPQTLGRRPPNDAPLMTTPDKPASNSNPTNGSRAGRRSAASPPDGNHYVH